MAKNYIGIDIGGTKILGAVVSESGKISKQFLIPTPRSKTDFLRNLKTAVAKLLSAQKISGIGVGVPGVLDMQRKVLLRAPNLPFLNGWRIEKFFAEFHLPVLTDNDSRCFLRAEAGLGAGHGYRNIAGLTIGTGIGGGIVIGGKIYFGAHNSAGEFGHVLMNKNRDLESLAGKKSRIPQTKKDVEIGRGVANIINVLNPEIIILGGGAVTESRINPAPENKSGVNLSEIKRIAKKHILSPLAQKTSIVKGVLGQTAQAIGAAMLFRSSKF